MGSTDPRPPAILVLAQGEANSLSEKSKERIRRALTHVEEWWKTAGNRRDRPRLIFAAGIGSRKSPVTLAKRMMEFAITERDRMGLSKTSFHVICNGDEPAVWGTELEVKWGFEHAGSHSTPRLTIVTGAGHMARALRYARRYEIESVEAVLSNDPPAPWYHEMILARAMEIAVMLKLGRLCRPFRRMFYRGG